MARKIKLKKKIAKSIYSKFIQNWMHRFVRLSGIKTISFLISYLINTMATVTRYSDKDLLEFQLLLESKLEKANNQLNRSSQSLADTAESKDREGDWMDDSTTSTDIQMLEAMVARQRKHILDLNNALQRIKNRSYGICVVTGKLIDKRRLLAVPTTTKCIAAKQNANQPSSSPEIKKPKTKPKNGARKVLTKIIRKPSVTKATEAIEDMDDEDVEDLYGVDYEATDDVDLDNYSEEDLED